MGAARTKIDGIMQYGFVAFNGVRWADIQVDEYNAIQKRIEQFKVDGNKPSDAILNASHCLFCAFSLLFIDNGIS